MVRAFIAINIPEQLKEKIWKNFSEKISSREIKLVEKENLHLTLLFLGEIPENYLEEIKKRLAPISESKRFEVKLCGIGCFAPRVLWLGFSQGEEKIKELHDKVCKCIGLKDEKFSAHLTIARNKRMPARNFYNLVERLKKETFCESFSVTSVDIMQSTLTSSGPIYKKIAEIKLSA